jgi:hypothetical protein
MNLRNRQLSVLFIAGLFYFILVNSYYHHEDFSLRSGCGLCKFVAESCLADNSAPAQPVLPHFTPLYALPEAPVHVGASRTSGTITRAPPAPILPDQV